MVVVAMVVARVSDHGGKQQNCGDNGGSHSGQCC